MRRALRGCRRRLPLVARTAPPPRPAPRAPEGMSHHDELLARARVAPARAAGEPSEQRGLEHDSRARRRPRSTSAWSTNGVSEPRKCAGTEQRIMSRLLHQRHSRLCVGSQSGAGANIEAAIQIGTQRHAWPSDARARECSRRRARHHERCSSLSTSCAACDGIACPAEHVRLVERSDQRSTPVRECPAAC